ncbi:hypothetical protein ABLE91_24515 [Aquabacter sp. CN5-332]|uniref:hypothetical protein n=1 Tax=Aquabacter sp. CN5-332 TaxID=3156608 RepID=UPI0032B51B1B
MRYALIAAASAALLSTGAMAQENTYNQRTQMQAPRAYAPAVAPSQATTTFPQNVINPERQGAGITNEDRLFLMQGDRGLGNG